MTGRTEGGFTLIELMVTVAVVAILAAIAYPSYVEQVNRSKRAEGKAAIMQTSALLERYYTMNNTYNMPAALAPGSTNYTITFPPQVVAGVVVPNIFLITAVPNFTDARCGTLTYDQLGTKGTSVAGAETYCW